MGSLFPADEPDPARKAIKLAATIEVLQFASCNNKIQKLQASISAAEKCAIPVIAAVHGYCIGETAKIEYRIKSVQVGLWTLLLHAISDFANLIPNSQSRYNTFGKYKTDNF